MRTISYPSVTRQWHKAVPEVAHTINDRVIKEVPDGLDIKGFSRRHNVRRQITHEASDAKGNMAEVIAQFVE